MYHWLPERSASTRYAWRMMPRGMASRLGCCALPDPARSVAVLDNGGEVPVPWEVLQEPGMLEIGVIGYDSAGALVITTRVQAPYGSRIRIYPNTTCADDAPTASLPTPSVWEEVLASIGSLRDLKTDAKNNLVAAINEVLSKGGGGGMSFTTDDTLLPENGVLRVNTANSVEQDNSLPITSCRCAYHSRQHRNTTQYHLMEVDTL